MSIAKTEKTKIMSSSYVGNERGNGSSSSRKGKKGNSEKPKQPQRGLGVAQLEKIRLHGQMACAYHPSFPTPYPSTTFNNEDLGLQTGYSSIPSSSFSYPTSSSSSSPSYGLHPNITMGLAEQHDRTSIRYGDNSQSSHFARWEPRDAILESHSFSQPSMSTRHLLDLQVEESQAKNSKKHRSKSMGSSSRNSESISDSEEVDLELRLSL